MNRKFTITYKAAISNAGILKIYGVWEKNKTKPKTLHTHTPPKKSYHHPPKKSKGKKTPPNIPQRKYTSMAQSKSI